MCRSERLDKRGRLSKEELANDERPFKHIADRWMVTIGKHYDEYLQKLKKMILLKDMGSIEEVDDIVNDTILLCHTAISRNGLKDTTEQGMKNYFFRAFQMNYRVKSNYDKRKDPNIDITNLLANEINEDDSDLDIKRDFWITYIFNKIEENFDSDTYNIFKYKLLNGVTYKKLREIYPNVDKQKSRINAVNDFIKTISINELYDEYEHSQTKMMEEIIC